MGGRSGFNGGREGSERTCSLQASPVTAVSRLVPFASFVVYFKIGPSHFVNFLS